MGVEYYTADEVSLLLDVSSKTAYKRIRQIYNLLQEKNGQTIIIGEKGRVPIKLFHAYYPYIPELKKGEE